MINHPELKIEDVVHMTNATLLGEEHNRSIGRRFSPGTLEILSQVAQGTEVLMLESTKDSLCKRDARIQTMMSILYQRVPPSCDVIFMDDDPRSPKSRRFDPEGSNILQDHALLLSLIGFSGELIFYLPTPSAVAAMFTGVAKATRTMWDYDDAMLAEVITQLAETFFNRVQNPREKEMLKFAFAQYLEVNFRRADILSYAPQYFEARSIFQGSHITMVTGHKHTSHLHPIVSLGQRQLTPPPYILPRGAFETVWRFTNEISPVNEEILYSVVIPNLY